MNVDASETEKVKKACRAKFRWSFYSTFDPLNEMMHWRCVFRKKWQLSLHFYSVRKRLSRFSFLPSASPRSCSNYRSSKLNGSNIQHNLLKKFFIEKTIFPLSGGFCRDLLLPSFTLGNDIHSFRECWTALILLRCLLLYAPSYFSCLHKRLMGQT